MQTLSQSPLDPAFVQNPYPFYERARALGPFFRWTDYDLPCTGNAAAVNAIFRDRRFTWAQVAERIARIYLRGMASPFNAASEIWAPRYRQATMGARHVLLACGFARKQVWFSPSHTLVDGEPR